MAHLSILDDETIVDTRLQHLQHLRILHIVADVLQDIPVRDNAKCTEDHPDRNVDLDIRYRGLHDLPGLEVVPAMATVNDHGKESVVSSA